ncbi:hypothetical protein JST56_04150, partial [Candidatus Dependentiae bacterium]|nr:hypothetical protein [Candidatus Dependentiae bacterium]
MDIRSLLKKTVSHTKSLFAFHTQNISFTHKLSRYNFFNKRIQIKHLLNVAQINFIACVRKAYTKIAAIAEQANVQSVAIAKQASAQVVSIFSKSYSGIKASLLWAGLVIKNICLKLVGFAYQTGLAIKSLSVNSGVQVKTTASRLVINLAGYAKKVGTTIVACIKQITVRSVAISKQITAQVISLFSKSYSGIKDALLWGANVLKNICLKLVGFVHQTGLLIKSVSVNSGMHVKTTASGLVTGFVGYANRLGTGFGGLVKKVSTKIVACLKQTTAQVIAISSKSSSGIKNALLCGATG